MTETRVLVIGSPGGGKSTFSRQLGKILSLPVIHLDQLFWNSDRTTVPREEFDRRLGEALAGDCWIIDGNFQRTMEWRMERCQTVFFLDYPVEVCLQGVRARFGKPREDIPWVETEEDPEFLQMIREFPEKTRPKILALREKYPEKRWITFSSREEADRYLEKIEG
jgi:adenylate kinase family enzyme